MNNKLKNNSSSSVVNDLPRNWLYCDLEKVVTGRKGKKPNKLSDEKFDNSIPYLDIKAIETGKIDQYADKLSSAIVTEQELIVVWDGSRSGWVGKGQYGALGSTLVALSPIVINYDYLFYFLQSQFHYINSNTKGSGIPHVDQDIFWKLSFPLAPIEDQKRIANKLQKSLVKLQIANESLNNIPDIIAATKNKILRSAFSGKLTSQWRNNQRNFKYDDELFKFKKNDIGWYSLKAENACDKVSSGSTPKGKRFQNQTGIPFLKVYNIVNQTIDFKYKPQFIDKKIHANQKRSIVLPNDVLINIVGPPLGKVALVPYDYAEWNINQALVLFRSKQFLLPEFLYYFFCEGSEIKIIENQYHGSAGQSNISLTQCRNFTILVPSIPEQKEIIKEIRLKFKKLNTVLQQKLEVKDNIKKSIQKLYEQAFSGQLVEQNFKEEVASKLMEKINTEKISVLKDIKIERKMQSDKKRIYMKNKKNINVENIIKEEFGARIFSFQELEQKVDLDYDSLKDEVFKLLDKQLTMEFNEQSGNIHFKIKKS
jgi:type I restriction enzyme S subunit